MIFHRFEGKVQDHGDYVSVETPDNPGYFWGNYLIFDRPPVKGDAERWRRLFKDRFAANPEIRHETFNWENHDSIEPHLAEFLEAGFTASTQLTLVADRLSRPEKWNCEIEIRPLEDAGDWAALLDQQVQIYGDEYGANEYREYREKRNARFRRMIERGMGAWFGAFLDGRLVGDLGLFHKNGAGRFQLVGTHPDFRRHGICRTLLYTAGTYGLEKMGLQTLVIAADAEYFAKDIYASLGFEVRERLSGLEKRPEVSSRETA
jgi:RimJ/RimL family protein N-acetyltransferase